MTRPVPSVTKAARPSGVALPLFLPLLLLPLLAALASPPPSAANQAYNSQTMALNEATALLARAADRAAGDPVKRTDWFLAARKLLDECRARRVEHPGLDPAAKQLAEAEKRLRDELWELVNANLSETDHLKSLKFLRQLLRIAPEDPNYRKWEATLTRKDLLDHQARVYSGTGDDPGVTHATLRTSQIREWLDLAFEEFSERHFDAAKRKYQHVQKSDPGNVEAEKRLAEIERIRPLLNDLESLAARVGGLRAAFSFGRRDPADWAEARSILERVEAADPNLAFRRWFAHPKEPASLHPLEPRHPKRQSFARRAAALKEEHLRHLHLSATVRLALGETDAAARLLGEMLRTDPDALAALEVGILVEDARGRRLNALAKLRDYMRRKGHAGHVISLYARAPFNLGDPDYRFLLASHARIYAAIYWPMMMLGISLAASLAWSGHRTFRLWDEVTDGLLLRILTFSNKTPMEYFDQGNACVASRNLEKAVKLFTKALEVDKGFAEAYYARGLARVELTEYEEARKDLEAHVRLRPGHGKALYHLAVCLDQLGRRAEAIVTIEQAIGLGLQSREFNLEEAERNKSIYRRVMNDYFKTAETLLEVRGHQAARRAAREAAEDDEG